jgi:hypothetical protein
MDSHVLQLHNYVKLGWKISQEAEKIDLLPTSAGDSGDLG